MTATISPPSTPSSASTRRPPTLIAAGGGVIAAAGALAICLLVGVIGWFLTDGGLHGKPHDGLRSGAIAWLMAHGSGVHYRGVPITAVPLGLTLFCAWMVWRTGMSVGESMADQGPDAKAIGAGEKDWTVPIAVGLFAGSYVIVAVVTGVLAGGGSARLSLGAVIVWSLLMSGVVGGAALSVGSGRAAVWLALLPMAVRATAYAVGSILRVFLILAALVFLVALAMDLGDAASAMSRLHADTSDSILFVALMLLAIPNAVIWAGSYLLGPGFTVGTGTIVSPAAVAIGPVPMFPMLAALPDNGPTPAWTPYLVALPVICAFVGAFLAQRRYPTLAWDQGALRGCVAGVSCAVVFAIVAIVAGGAVGPGRMADVGPIAGDALFYGVGELGIGGMLGGLAATFWQRRQMGRPLRRPKAA